jgi:hypothetical protein
LTVFREFLSISKEFERFFEIFSSYQKVGGILRGSQSIS